MKNHLDATDVQSRPSAPTDRQNFRPASMQAGITSAAVMHAWHEDLQGAPLRSQPVISRRASEWIFRIALLLSDTVLVSLAFAVAYWLRFEVGITFEPEVVPDLQQYVSLVIVLIPVWLIIFWLMHLYDLQYLLGGTSEYTNAFQASSIGMMMVVLASFMFPDFRISRIWLLLSWGLSATLVCIGRLLLRRVAYHLRRAGFYVSPTLIIGTNAEAVALARQLRNSLASGLTIVGFVAEHQDATEREVSAIDGIPVVGNLASLSETVKEYEIQEVIIASTAMAREQLIQIPKRLATTPNVQLRLSSGLYEIFTTGMRVTTKNSVPLMSVNQLRLDRFESTIKALLDCSLILFAIPFLVPIFLVIAALIKIDSPGSVFYRRRVLGVGGKEFDALKFRTMYSNGDEILAQYPELVADLEANHKLKSDPRITRMGRFLRATSLDEIPQLINVLFGDMSLVGPRMISPAERTQYGQMQLNLLTVKPGLTGLWQVSGRSDLSYTERVQLDMHYIRNYSLWLDLQILFFQTIPAVLKRRGAY